MGDRSWRKDKPVIPFIQLYDDAGGQGFTNAGQWHTWDSESFKTSDFHYTLDDNRVQINREGEGYFEITFECSYMTYVEGNILITSQVFKNGTALSGAKSILSVSGAAAQVPAIRNTQTLHFIVYLNSKDYIQIKTTTDNAGNTYSLGDTSRLLIKFVPIHGWNNSKAGKESYIGGVMR